MKRVKNLLRHLFSMSKGEANGLVILLPLILAVMLLPTAFKYLFEPAGDFKKEYAQLDAMIASISLDTSHLEETRLISFREFDPHQVTKSELITMGVPARVAGNWEKYLQGGGRFKQSGDIKKIYGMTDSVYALMEPYIRIKNTDHVTKKRLQKYNKTAKKPEVSIEWKVEPFDLNTADTTELKQVRGIGPVLSKRIVKYRDLLGGFIAKDQLKEVYGLKPEVLKRLDSLSYIRHGANIRLVEINVLSEKELARHPYLSYQVADAIVAYRYQHGNFQGPDDLYKLHRVDSATVVRLQPYLKF